MTKCVDCRFRAKVDGKEVEGRIAVDGDYLQFFYDNGDIYSIHIPFYWEHGKVDYFDDFEIVPRDPETYRDWQVGDIIWDSHESGDNGRIIFRSGDFVAADIDGCRCYTCRELFDEGYRLLLTDIEQKIIEEKKKYEPQDGDICFVRTAAGNCFIFIKRDHKPDEGIHSYACFDTNLWCLCSTKVSFVCDRKSIRELRPATDEEKKRLFDAMAKQGKRWNAEKKVVEGIPKPYEFKKGEPVLVRDYENSRWLLAAYSGEDSVSFLADTGKSAGHWNYCIPYNERTMHLLGTAEDYKEGE